MDEFQDIEIVITFLIDVDSGGLYCWDWRNGDPCLSLHVLNWRRPNQADVGGVSFYLSLSVWFERLTGLVCDWRWQWVVGCPFSCRGDDRFILCLLVDVVWSGVRRWALSHVVIMGSTKLSSMIIPGEMIGMEGWWVLGVGGSRVIRAGPIAGRTDSSCRLYMIDVNSLAMTRSIASLRYWNR
jgi:hypothetical protein